MKSTLWILVVPRSESIHQLEEDPVWHPPRAGQCREVFLAGRRWSVTWKGVHSFSKAREEVKQNP